MVIVCIISAAYKCHHVVVCANILYINAATQTTLRFVIQHIRTLTMPLHPATHMNGKSAKYARPKAYVLIYHVFGVTSQLSIFTVVNIIRMRTASCQMLRTVSVCGGIRRHTRVYPTSMPSVYYYTRIMHYNVYENIIHIQIWRS